MKLIAVCPQYETEGPGAKQALERTVRKSMEQAKGSVSSASGMTASLAINYCERRGLPYTVKAGVSQNGEHHYFVQRQ